jgi:hypothetical protein
MINDYSKYKRFFTFGCSFTGYKYPTWADIMSKNLPSARFYNISQSGGGNTYIASRLTEDNRVYKFCETDLVMVMWSTYCREDRWVKDKSWITPGNIYSQREYDFTDNAYLCNWADPTTFIVRDLAIIDITTSYLNNLPCDTFGMLSVPFTYQQDFNNNQTLTDFLALYKDLEESYPPSMFVQEMNSTWGYSCEYTSGHDEELFRDYHPSPEQYCQYLQKIGVSMTDEAMSFTSNATAILAQIKEESQFNIAFPKIDPRTAGSRELI